MEDQTDLTWRKSSYSGNGGNNCVEVGTGQPGKIAVRDSKHREEGVLVIESVAFAALLADVRSGRFDT
jgi:Domain of unknown function (DUF397)